MPSNLYFTAVVPTVGPTAGTKATYLPLASPAINNVWPGSEVNSSFTEVPPDDTNQQSRQCPMLNDTANRQTYYLGRFCTLPLDAQTIPAQSWDYRNVVCGEWNTQCNTYHWPVIYVWRPSTNSVVGYCLNASAQMGVEWAVTPAGVSGQLFAGEAVTCQAGDILVCEFWASGILGMTGSQQLQWLWTQASNTYIASPYKLVYYSGPVGPNTPSTADTLVFSPMTAFAATSTVTRNYTSNAVPLTLSPMSATAATSGVVKVYNSVADPMTYAPMVPFDATATVTRNYTSSADPATYATTPVDGEEFFSGITNFFPCADQALVFPSGGLKAGSLPKVGNNNVASGSAVEGSLPLFWGGGANIANRTTATVSNTVVQSHFFGRFSSRPLAAQTIPAQNWNYAVVVGEGNLNANAFLWPVMYVYRPSNSTVVGYVFNAAADAGTELPATAATATRTFAGARVAGIQDGDILVVEAWTVTSPTIAGIYTQTFRITDNTSKIASQYKVLFAPNSVLFFSSATPTSSPTAGTKATYLPKTPTATQHTAWGTAEGALPETIVHNPVWRGVVSKANTTAQSLFLGRYSTPPLAAQTIPAQLWSWEVSAGQNNANAHTFNWPVLYIWRPSTSQVVSYILDASANYGIEWRLLGDPRLDQQFSGASADVQAGDLLVCELWAVNVQTAATAYSEDFWINAQNSDLVSPYKLRYYTGAAAITSTADPTAYSCVAPDAISTVTVYAPPLMETLTENFEAPLDTGKWTTSNFDGTVTFTGGVGVFDVSTGIAGAQAEIFSAGPFYDLRQSKVFFKLVKPFKQVGDPSTADFSLGIMSPGNNTLAFAQNTAGYLRIIKFTGGAWGHVADITFSYFAEEDTYRWLQIREQAGTTYFESAPSSASNPPTAGQWVVRHSALTNTLPVNFASCQPVFWIYTNAGGTKLQAAQIDGFNTAASAGAAAAITSVADPMTYAPMVPVAATSSVQDYSNANTNVYAPMSPVAATSSVQAVSNAVPLTFAPMSPTAATSSITRVYTSNAVAASYALAPVAATSSVAVFSNAVATTYTLAPVAATSIYVPTAGNVGPAAYALAAAAAVSSVQGNSAALPFVFSFAATATGTGRGWASVGNAGLYALGAAPGSGSIGRVGIASPGSFSQAGFPGWDTGAYYSSADPIGYSTTGIAATVSLGRVYSSVASSTGFAQSPNATGDTAALFSVASPLAFTPLAATAATSGFAVYSVALQANYTHTAPNATASVGRTYTSTATATNFFTAPSDAGDVSARFSSASPTAYSQTAIAATSGVVRIVFSTASPITYSHTAPDSFSGIVRIIPSNAVPAVYFNFPQDAQVSLARTSIALPFTYAPLTGTATTSGFARSSLAIEVAYNLVSPVTSDVLGRTYTSVASPAAYVLSPGYPGDAVADNSTATSTAYSSTVFAATAFPSKNSIALQANYAHDPPNTQSGRITFSTASPVAFTVASPATNSYVPGKVASVALPPTFLTTATASNHRRDYATKALAALYLQAPYVNSDRASNEVKPPIIFPLPSPMSAVTDEQFAAWLNDDHAIRVVLIETKCVDPVTNMTESVFFASRGFVTKIEDGPNAAFYAPLMRGGLEFAQTIDLDLQGNQSYGDIELDNTEGDLDWMFDRVWLYKEFKAYVGDATWPRRDFRQIFDGTIEDIDSSMRDTVNVRLRDKLYRLDMPITDSKVGGIGPNADQLVPITFGECHNITPLIYSAKDLIYVYHARLAEGQLEVRDNGVPVASTFLQGAPQSFQLQKQPYGRVTCSVQGDKTPTAAGFTGGYVNTVASLVRRLLIEWGTIAANRFTAADIDVRNFTVFDAKNKAPVGLHATERMTVLEACQQLAASVGARLTMTALGKVQLVKLKLPPDDDSTPVNLQYNGDFSALLDGWTYNGGSGGVAPDATVGINLSDVWTPPNTNTFYAHQQGIVNNPEGYFEYIGKAIPVEPGKQYVVSAYTGAHRCRVAIYFSEYNEAGTLLGGVPVLPTTAFNNAEALGGQGLSGYKQIYNSQVTASTTRWIRVVMRKYDTISGNTDSWIFANTVSFTGTESNVLPTIVVTESDMVSGSLHIADRLPLVPGARLGYCKNWTIQEDTAQGVPEDHKEMYRREWLTVSIAEAVEQENCLLLDSYSANNECTRRVALRSSQRHVYEFVGFANLMFTPVGAAMKVIHRRFNLSAGKTGQVVSVAVNWLTSQVTIRVLI